MLIEILCDELDESSVLTMSQTAGICPKKIQDESFFNTQVQWQEVKTPLSRSDSADRRWWKVKPKKSDLKIFWKKMVDWSEYRVWRWRRCNQIGEKYHSSYEILFFVYNQKRWRWWWSLMGCEAVNHLFSKPISSLFHAAKWSY